MSAGSTRAVLRSGMEGDVLPEGPQKGVLIAVPLFHVIGMSSLVVCLQIIDGLDLSI